MSHTCTTTPLAPSDIARAIHEARPDLHVSVDEHGPAGLTLLVTTMDAENAAYATPDGALLFGTAAGYLGWSNGDGERGGGWEGLVDDTYAEWETDQPMCDGPLALARIAMTVAEELPKGAEQTSKLERRLHDSYCRQHDIFGCPYAHAPRRIR